MHFPKLHAEMAESKAKTKCEIAFQTPLTTLQQPDQSTFAT